MTSSRGDRARAVLFAVAIGVGSTAAAEHTAGARDCARIADREARLNCYDAIFAAPAGQSAGAPVGVESSAGAPLAIPATSAQPLVPAPSPAAQFGENARMHVVVPGAPQPLKQIDVSVARVDQLGNGLFRLALDNDQVWVTKESDPWLEFKVGDPVRISRTVLGGYRISIRDGHRDVLANRVH